MLEEIIKIYETYHDVIELIAIIIITFIIFSILLKLIKRHLLKKVKTKKQVSNVTVFLDMLKYLFAFLLLIIIFISYYGKWGEIGFLAGLLTVAIGWALQKPISGVVAWLIIVTRRPFSIGDRLLISNIKGELTNITLTHILLDEIGGTIEGEEKSGRTVMIPTSFIFEQEIINYTEKDDYIMDEISTVVTYESNLEKAEKIISTAVANIMSIYWDSFPNKVSKDSNIRLLFKDSGVEIKVRYYTIAFKRNELSTDIHRMIYNKIKSTFDVEFAYPHTEVLLREKKPKLI